MQMNGMDSPFTTIAFRAWNVVVKYVTAQFPIMRGLNDIAHFCHLALARMGYVCEIAAESRSND